MAEVGRILTDIAGGYVADLPSDKDLQNPEVGPLIEKYRKGVAKIPTKNRISMLRLIEKMVMESADTISDIYGGGSAAAHRITILRESDLEYKKRCAKRLAGIE